MAMDSILLIVSGIILLVGVLDKIPGIGKDLKKFALWLASFGVIIGILDIIAALI